MTRLEKDARLVLSNKRPSLVYSTKDVFEA